MINLKHVLIAIIFVSIFSGCISQPPPSEKSVPTVIPTATTMVESEPLPESSISASIYIGSSAENITIYVPVLLDENKNVLELYENPTITGRATTSLIDTEHGKALKISRSGLDNYLFNWNEVPGKDTNRFVIWMDGKGYVWPGEKPDINKTDDGKAITVSGTSTRIFRLNETGVLEFYSISDSEIGGGVKFGYYPFNWTEVPGKDTDRFVRWMEGEGHVQPGEKLDISKTEDGKAITVSGRGTWIYQLNDNGDLKFDGVIKNVMSEMFGEGLYFAKEENGNLNIYNGNNELNMNESHGKLKDEQTTDEFFTRFTISMSNYIPPEHFTTMRNSPPEIDAWVYSDSDVEKVRFYFYLDPRNPHIGISMYIGTDGWVHLRKGWQVVNLKRSMYVV